MVAHVTEEILLAPAAEAPVRYLGGRQVGPGGDHLGLVAAVGVEPGDLAGGEVASTFGVFVTEAALAVGEPVRLVPAEVVHELVL